MSKIMAGESTPHDQDVESDEWFKANLLSGNYRALTDSPKAGNSGALVVPSLAHYLPTRYTVGLAGKHEPTHQLLEEVDYGGLERGRL